LAGFLLGFLFDPNGGGNVFLQNVSWLGYMALIAEDIATQHSRKLKHINKGTDS
jgi:hypothetical protein